MQKLKSTQNGVIRAVFGAHFRDLANACYSHLKILQIVDLVKFEVAKFVYGSLTTKLQIHFANISVKLTAA